MSRFSNFDKAVLGALRDNTDGEHTPIQRGQTLRSALQRATQQLDEEQQKLLTVSFFKRNRYRNNDGVAFELNLTRRTYYRYRGSAIRDTARALIRSVLPPLRLEIPQLRHLVGRDGILAQCRESLAKHESIALLGPGGIGKTALATQLAQDRSQEGCFWFTFRPLTGVGFYKSGE